MRLYDFPDSGNGYKVRLLLAHLARTYEYVPVDILSGGSRTSAFLAKNPNGRIPVLELDDGRCLAESNAILFFLAQGTTWWPDAAIDRARVLQWTYFEQYSHEPNLATVRFWLKHDALTPERKQALPEKRRLGEAALGVMETHLAGRRWFVGETPTIADLSLYAYTHVAAEGGFELASFPGVRAWLARVAGLPGHVPITAWQTR